MESQPGRPGSDQQGSTNMASMLVSGNKKCEEMRVGLEAEKLPVVQSCSDTFFVPPRPKITINTPALSRSENHLIFTDSHLFTKLICKITPACGLIVEVLRRNLSRDEWFRVEEVPDFTRK